MAAPNSPWRPSLRRRGTEMAPPRVRGLHRGQHGAHTVRAYRSDLRHFSEWCCALGLPVLPATPEIVALYIAELAETHRPATLTRRLSAISQERTRRPATSPPTRASDSAQDDGGHPPQQRNGTRLRRRLRSPTCALSSATISPTISGVASPPRQRVIAPCSCWASPGPSAAPSSWAWTAPTSSASPKVSSSRCAAPRRTKRRRAQGRHPLRQHPEAFLSAPWRRGCRQLASRRPGLPPGDLGARRSRRLSDRAVALVVKRYAAAIGRDPATFAATAYGRDSRRPLQLRARRSVTSWRRPGTARSRCCAATSARAACSAPTRRQRSACSQADVGSAAKLAPVALPSLSFSAALRNHCALTSAFRPLPLSIALFACISTQNGRLSAPIIHVYLGSRNWPLQLEFGSVTRFVPSCARPRTRAHSLLRSA